jgi:hypothetical protein
MANFGNLATKKKGWKIFPFTEIKISNYLRLSKVYRKRMAYTLFKWTKPFFGMEITVSYKPPAKSFVSSGISILWHL